jgi:acetylornithine deacetylase/succinyl-diaminopimelate desuccinylase-like protein
MKHIAERIQPDQLLNLTRTLVEIPSVTGQEQPIADWMFNYLKSLGLGRVQRLPVEDAGETIVGWLGGSEKNPEMMLMFH